MYFNCQDEEAELLAELERIKKERAAEAARKATEEAASAEASAKDELIRGNPLILGGAASFQARVMSRLPSSWLKPLQVVVHDSWRCSPTTQVVNGRCMCVLLAGSL